MFGMQFAGSRKLSSARTAKPRGAVRRPTRLFEPLEDRTLYSTYMVTNLSDHGTGSLRQAVLNTNAHAGSDTIAFAKSLHGTIALTTGQLSISGSVDIVGPGASALTVSGNHASRVFLNEANAWSTISGLTISNANPGISAGGGIFNIGNLTLTGDVISNNVAASFTVFGTGFGGAGLQNSGTANISKCVFENNSVYCHDSSGLDGGGAIYNSGSITLSASVIEKNAADVSPAAQGSAVVDGGGIFNSGNAAISQTSVSYNSANGLDLGSYSENGGGIYNSGSMNVRACTVDHNVLGPGTGLNLAAGCGLYTQSTLSLVNSTIYGNTSWADGCGGGLAEEAGFSSIVNCTITQNTTNGIGGGINITGGFLAMGNTIVAGNSDGADDAGQTHDFSNVLGTGTLDSLGHNLIGNVGFATYPFISSDQVGHGSTFIDPGLGTLTFNGGPTETCAIKSSSPAYNKGSSSLAAVYGLTTDQRGFARVQFGTVDIGAFEL